MNRPVNPPAIRAPFSRYSHGVLAPRRRCHPGHLRAARRRDTYTSTLVIVGGFTRPEFKVEVEVTAARLP